MSKYVVIDLEMCNVPESMKEQYSARMETIQIGAILLDESYEILDQFDSYVAPEFGYIDSFINELTGISGENVQAAPTLREVLNRFMDWLPAGEVHMVSWSDSDKIQLRQETEAKNIVIDGLESLLEGWIDSQKTFADKLDTKRRYSLKEALAATDIVSEGRPHNGLADAYNTALLFRKLETEEKLRLNPLYAASMQDEVKHLSFSMGDIFAKMNLQIGAVA